jgi:hypothetical protein
MFVDMKQKEIQMRKRLIIDGHIHCGPRKFDMKVTELWNPIEHVKKDLEEIGVKGAVLLPFAEDIYRKPYASRETAKMPRKITILSIPSILSGPILSYRIIWLNSRA